MSSKDSITFLDDIVIVPYNKTAKIEIENYTKEHPELKERIKQRLKGSNQILIEGPKCHWEGTELIMEKDTNFLNQLLDFAKLSLKYNEARKELNKHRFMQDFMTWEVDGIYENCVVKNGCLYDNIRLLLSEDGSCMDESIPYFVNQSTGYCEDDYYGTLFIQVKEGTFVAISYRS